MSNLKEKVTVAEAASMEGVSKAVILNRIRKGRYPGAEKFGWLWTIPKKALKKKD